jgi:hypothetical protein
MFFFFFFIIIIANDIVLLDEAEVENAIGVLYDYRIIIKLKRKFYRIAIQLC